MRCNVCSEWHMVMQGDWPMLHVYLHTNSVKVGYFMKTLTLWFVIMHFFRNMLMFACQQPTYFVIKSCTWGVSWGQLTSCSLQSFWMGIPGNLSTVSNDIHGNTVRHTGHFRNMSIFGKVSKNRSENFWKHFWKWKHFLLKNEEQRVFFCQRYMLMF